MTNINPDITVSELIASWVDGNQAWVLQQLLNDHVGLTAVLLVQGLADGTLSKADANRIANRLIDARLTALAIQDNA